MKPVLKDRVVDKAPLITIQHYAAIHNKKYMQQPQGFEMGVITNDIKRKGHAELHTSEQLLEAFSCGQSILLSNFEIDSQNSVRFISSSAFAIDVDDDLSVTDPLQILEFLKDICAGLFYTFSHGKKGNRYRLLFQLDRPITKQEDLADLIDYMIHYLKNKGLPVDGQAKSPTQIIRGGIAGYEVNDLSTVLKLDVWLQASQIRSSEKRKVIEVQRAKNSEGLKDHLNNPVTFEELREMCEVIDHIPSGAGDEVTQKWLQIVYALKNQVQMGLLDNEQGFELFNIVSGGESSERYWESIKPSGLVSVGTIIHHANDVGYKRKHKYKYALLDTPETIVTERIKVDKYIPTNVAIDLLQRQEKLIIDSPTGSGKTTAFMDAFKELKSKKFDYFIFAVPTIALSEQVAKKHNVTCAKGGIKGFKHMITEKAISGERVFVSTFDKTAEIVSYLENGIDYGNDPKPEFHIVVDEIHKYTDAYNYRFAAIDRLKELSNIATSLIGLSGTTEDILKDDFDKLIKIDNGNKSSPNLDYRVFTYDTNENGVIVAENADLMLVPVVRGLLQQTRVLIFINNKERIKRIARILKGEGITVQTVSSSDRKSATYTSIIENGEIEEGVQVVICTTVLADGISINNRLDWSCVIVADRESPIFNPSTIKQISNRFRNQYRYFALYMRTPNPDYAEIERFNIESEYRYRLKTVRNHVDYLNKEFEGELLQDFIPSTVEKYNGIFHKSTDEAAKIEYNPLFVRHQSMKTKETYYAVYRNAFIGEVGRTIGHKLTGVFNVNDEVRKNGSDLSGLLAEMQAEKEKLELEADELRANYAIYFTEEVYENFVHKDDEEALKLFKESIHADQFSATLRNSLLTDFETCKALGESVKRRADINKYTNDVRGLVEIASFDYVNKVTVTKRVFNEVLKMANKKYFSSDFKEIIEKDLPKKLKVSKKDVTEVVKKMFHKTSTKTGGVAYAVIHPLNVGLVAKIRHGIETDAVERSVLKHIETRSPQQQKVLYAAVAKKWKVKWLKDDVEIDVFTPIIYE